jgi:hypothetical protein
MKDVRIVAEKIAEQALLRAPSLVADNRLSSINNMDDAVNAIEAAVTQDSAFRSIRIWAALLGILGLVLGGISVALAMPEAREAWGASATVYSGIIGSIASGAAGAAALISKMFDPRPTK